MSGLEALAALGLACNIFQVISFGHESISLLKKVYQDGTLDTPDSFHAEKLGEIAKDIQKVDVPEPVSKEDQQLLDVANKCREVATALQKEIAFLDDRAQKGSQHLRNAIKAAVKKGLRKRRLEKLEHELDEYETLMQSSILAKVW